MWQLSDGKWRWIFYDGDACLEAQSFDVFANATYDGDEGYPSSRRATLFFRRLLENDQFREQFVHRFNELASTTFSYQNTKPYYDYIYQVLLPEVPNQVERFNCPQAYSSWENYCMPVIDFFLRERPEKIIEALNNFVSVDEFLAYVFSCYPNPFSDEIHIDMEAENFGANEVIIYDLLGKMVFSKKIVAENSNEITLNPELPAGVYVLKVGSHSQRIVRY